MKMWAILYKASYNNTYNVLNWRDDIASARERAQKYANENLNYKVCIVPVELDPFDAERFTAEAPVESVDGVT